MIFWRLNFQSKSGTQSIGWESPVLDSSIPAESRRIVLGVRSLRKGWALNTLRSVRFGEKSMCLKHAWERLKWMSRQSPEKTRKSSIRNERLRLYRKKAVANFSVKALKAHSFPNRVRDDLCVCVFICASCGWM